MQTKAEMKEQLCVPMVSRGPKSEAQALSCAAIMSDLASDLAIEKRANAELLHVVNSQRDQLDELANIVQEGEKQQTDMEARIEKLGEIILNQR
jgi:hypothetical protein